jgi:anthranilate synthase/aminodeoxychorismate synthase-like glutamine amidotransferase
MRLLVIDNYDSFTYNLVQYFGELGATVTVKRNDEITVEEARALQPERICISPGPGRPENAGICPELIADLGMDVPILGVCLGHQCIAQVFGAKIVRAPTLMHGKTSLISHSDKGIFHSLAQPLPAMRYHSLVVEIASFPECLEVTATADDGEVMGLQHRDLPLHGVQFHPESILTGAGKDLLKNFLQI